MNEDAIFERHLINLRSPNLDIVAYETQRSFLFPSPGCKQAKLLRCDSDGKPLSRLLLRPVPSLTCLRLSPIHTSPSSAASAEKSLFLVPRG